jgi:hypothetical protein
MKNIQVVVAGGDRVRAGGSQSGGEEVDVRLLVVGDLLKASSRPLWVPCSDKIVLRELGETLSIEVRLEVL